MARLAVLVLVTVAAYSNSFTIGFPLDNQGLILDDARVHAATDENTALILGHTYWWPVGESGLYRPLTTLSYLFNYAILRNADRPAGYHAVNLVLHIANVLLVYGLARRLLSRETEAGHVAGTEKQQRSQRPPKRSAPADSASATATASAKPAQPATLSASTASLAIAALWAVHPLSTEAVTNIVGRADLLAAFGVLAGLLAYLCARDSSGWRRLAWLIALAAATAVGVFSKEGAAVIAAVVALCELGPSSDMFPATGPGVNSDEDHRRGGRRRHDGQRWRFLVLTAVAVSVPLLSVAYARSVVLGASPAAEFPFVDNPIAGAGFVRGALTAVAVMGRYLWLLIWPVRLSADYSYSQIPLAGGTAMEWLAWIAVVALAAVVVASYWVAFAGRARDVRPRLVFFFGAFAFLAFLPASNLLFPTGTIMAERLMYLPSVGLIALFVLAIDALATRLRLPAAAPALVVIVAVALGVRTWTRNPDWRDNLTLWTATVAASPASFKAHRGLAEALRESDGRANLDGAIAEMEKSVSILAPLPDARNDARTHRELASYYLEKGDSAGSDALQHRTPLPPVSIDAYRKAIAMAQRTAAILDASTPTQPHRAASADALRLMSAAYVRIGDIAPAVESATGARALEPSDVVGHRQLAAALLAAERYEDAGVALMIGSLLTNSPELRQQLMELYRQGLDPLRCAVAATRDGPALNPGCPTVRRHLCAATADAIPLQIAAGNREDAERLRTSAIELGCR